MKKVTKKKLTFTPNYVRDKLKDIIDLTHNLAESHPNDPKDKNFLRILEFTFRRDVYTLLAIYYLSRHTALADSCSMLSRKIVEDAVVVEYMIQEGKEKFAKIFNNFVYVQIHDELKLMDELSFLSEDQKKGFAGLEKKYEKIKDKFKKPSGQKFNSPFGIGFEDMLRKLKFAEEDKQRLLLAYIKGSSKIHLNPGDLSSFKTNTFRAEEVKRSLVQSIIISIWAFSRLTTRYIDEIRETLDRDVYEDVATRVKGIFDDYLSQGHANGS